VSDDYEEFWLSLPEKALHPVRVPIVDALWWIGEPLSAVLLVDVLDGILTMWETAHHLRVLEALDVVEPAPGDTGDGTSKRDLFDLPYRLTEEPGYA
jgi:hypothetical protein